MEWSEKAKGMAETAFNIVTKLFSDQPNTGSAIDPVTKKTLNELPSEQWMSDSDRAAEQKVIEDINRIRGHYRPKTGFDI